MRRSSKKADPHSKKATDKPASKIRKNTKEASPVNPPTRVASASARRTTLLGRGCFIFRKLLVAVSSLLVLIFAVYVALAYSSGIWTPYECTLLQRGCRHIHVQGFVAPGWELVRDEYQRIFDEGNDLGSQLVVYSNGEKVVDLWGGLANIERQTPYSDRTLATTFSSAKAVSSLVIAMLADRGLLDYDAPIAKYWPEFAAHHKGNITVATLMKHSAGLAIVNISLDATVLGDLDTLAVLLSDQVPHYPPQGSKRAYHSFTRGLFENELVRRVDPAHRTIGQFIADEIARPLGVEFYLGNMPQQYYESRLATHYASPRMQVVAKTIIPYLLGDILPLPRSVMPAVGPRLTDGERRMLREAGLFAILLQLLMADAHANMFAEPEWRAVEVASGGAISNAASLAAIMSAVVDGRERLLTNDGVAAAMSGLETAYDWHLHTNTTLSDAGWGDMEVFGLAPGFFGWGGWGGSVAAFDIENRIGFGYLMNGHQGVLTLPVASRLSMVVHRCITMQR